MVHRVDKLLNLVRKLVIIDKEGRLTNLSNLRSEQLTIIQSILDGKSVIILKPRQIGSSTACLAALFVLWLTSEQPIHIVILSHKQSSSKELLDKVKVMYDGLPDVVKRAYPATMTTTSIRMLETGARFSAKGAGDKGGIRSFQCTHLLLSEFAFAERPEELLAASLAALNNGQLIMESTANHYGDALHQEILKAQSGETGYEVLFFGWDEHTDYQLDDLSVLE